MTYQGSTYDLMDGDMKREEEVKSLVQDVKEHFQEISKLHQRNEWLQVENMRLVSALNTLEKRVSILEDTIKLMAPFLVGIKPTF